MKNLKRFFLITLLIFSPLHFMAAQNQPPQQGPQQPQNPPPAGSSETQRPPRPPKEEERGEEFKYFRGKRIPNDMEPFIPVFVKINKSSDAVYFEIFFSESIDASSLKEGCILLNNTPVELSSLQFTKNRRGIRIKVSSDEQQYSLVIANIKTIYGKPMKKVELDNCQVDSEYRYFARENIWKKY